MLATRPKSGLQNKHVESLKGDPRISTYAAVATEYGLPIWSMFIPETTRDMFADLTKMQRLVRLMRDYLACSDAQRSHIEAMAVGLAEINRGRVQGLPAA